MTVPSSPPPSVTPDSPFPTPTPRALDWCVHLLVVGLLALAAVRAVLGELPHPAACVAAVVICGVVYAVGTTLPVVRTSRRAAALWLAALGAAWLLLLVLTPDAIWFAFPLFFLQLHLLPPRSGLLAVIVTTVIAVTGFAVHQGEFNPAMAIGPALGAAVAVTVVWGYQALYRESDRRRALIEELTATRADLAAAQHTAGVSAERDRLAREIHDTLAQGFSSIQLLLHAAERALPTNPENAARYVVQAREAAGDNLAEARRFVAALTPPSLDDSTLAAAVERLCTTTGDRHRIAVRFRLIGTPVPLPTAREVAVLRIAQSALANAVRHSGAASIDVELKYDGFGVGLGVADDGCGFDQDAVTAHDSINGGFGLPAMRARAHAVDGTLVVDSAEGRGTTVRARIPHADVEPEETHE